MFEKKKKKKTLCRSGLLIAYWKSESMAKPRFKGGEIDSASLVGRTARSQDFAKEKSGSIFIPSPSFYLVPSHALSPP